MIYFLFLLIFCLLHLCTDCHGRRRTNNANKQMKKWPTRSVLIFQNKMQCVKWGTCTLYAVWLVLLGFLSLAQAFSKCVWCEITCLRVSRVVAVFQCLSRVIWKHHTAFSRWHQTSAGHKSMFKRRQMTPQLSLRFRAFGKSIFLY